VLELPEARRQGFAALNPLHHPAAFREATPPESLVGLKLQGAHIALLLLTFLLRFLGGPMSDKPPSLAVAKG
jgi:hypothetical protein